MWLLYLAIYSGIHIFLINFCVYCKITQNIAKDWYFQKNKTKNRNRNKNKNKQKTNKQTNERTTNKPNQNKTNEQIDQNQKQNKQKIKKNKQTNKQTKTNKITVKCIYIPLTFCVFATVKPPSVTQKLVFKEKVPFIWRTIDSIILLH